MNEEIIEDIESKKEITSVTVEDKAMTTWHIFLIQGKKYAVKSSDVVEIISDLSVYHIPFMPKYIEGILNRRGEPFTVVNPNSIFADDPNSPPPDKSLFMIFKRDDDQLSLHISDILLFTKIEDTELKLIPDATEESFFLGTVTFDGQEIPVLNPNAFEVLIRKDCGSV
jgi:purine-binding chemotaxis protein CheW